MRKAMFIPLGLVVIAAGLGLEYLHYKAVMQFFPSPVPFWMWLLFFHH